MKTWFLAIGLTENRLDKTCPQSLTPITDILLKFTKRTRSMEQLAFRVCIFVAAFSACQCLLEASLGSMVETLRLTVQDLQGQVRALQNKTCGKNFE